jgi:AraC-like DNA-binding protein
MTKAAPNKASLTLIIRNMVCGRCISAVARELDALGIHVVDLALGEVRLINSLDAGTRKVLAARLDSLGFELLDDRRKQIIEQIKNAVIQLVQHGEIEEHFSMSAFISAQLHKEYSALSRLFSEVEGITIEQFFILQKIEKVKEWLVYGELSLSEISFRLGYSSVSHLSGQFKKITGLTPSHFKQIGAFHRRPVDQVHDKKM